VLRNDIKDSFVAGKGMLADLRAAGINLDDTRIDECIRLDVDHDNGAERWPTYRSQR